MSRPVVERSKGARHDSLASHQKSMKIAPEPLKVITLHMPAKPVLLGGSEIPGAFCPAGSQPALLHNL